jgi:DnaJ-class molecular chaperone
METCTRCGGEGYEEYEEDGRIVRDACYHCSTTGKIDEETHWQDRLVSVANTLAHQYVNELRDNCNDDPDGEGWDFRAAEHMMNPWDYYRSIVWEKQDEYCSQLFEMPVAKQAVLIAWNDFLVNQSILSNL